MSYLLAFLCLWAVVGAQLFQFSAYVPQTRWAKFAYCAAAGPIVWAIWVLNKLK